MSLSAPRESSDDEEDDNFTLKPLRRSMKILRNEISTILENLERIQSELSKPSVHDFLDSLLPKALESGVKGIAIYDFIVANLPHDLSTVKE